MAPVSDIDERFMRMALAEAEQAVAAGDVPVGAVVVDAKGRIVSRAHNRREQAGDATAHAEVIAVREACRVRGRWYLDDATIYVTKEPCVMCAGAMVQARLRRVVFGAADEKAGAGGSLLNLLEEDRLNHQVIVTRGVLEEEARALLQEFFRDLRDKNT